MRLSATTGLSVSIRKAVDTIVRLDVARMMRVAKRIRRQTREKMLALKAAIYRRQLTDAIFVGITGSAGKTTTKEIAAHLLSADGPCNRTFDSRNELVFVAETVLNTKKSDKYCVVELHGGEPGYLDQPLKVVRPDIGVLVSIGRDHFKSFNKVEEIANEKRKIVDRLPSHGVAVLNRDDPSIRKIGESCKRKIIWVGKDKDSDIRLVECKSDFPEPLTIKVEFEGKLYEIRTCLHGTYLATAVLVALGVAVAAKLTIDSAIKAVSNAPPFEGRMQVITTHDGVTFIRDDYKAPEWSVKEPIAFLGNAAAKRKIAVFGTLSDYSKSASKAYKQLAVFARQNVDLVVFVGPHALRALKARQSEDDLTIQAFPQIRGAASYLRNELRDGDVVLLKGSLKTDHLVRLYLDRERDVQCWSDECRLFQFCQFCDKVYSTTEAENSTDELDMVMREPLKPTNHTSSAGDTLIVIGLGNPGSKYANTPHNVGHAAVNMLVETSGNSWVTEAEGDVCTLSKPGSRLILLKPAVDVNFSGPVVRDFVEKHGCTHEDCILIHDDLDVPPGEFRRKIGGGDGGHKGVRSVVMALGTGNFSRFKVGVQQPNRQDESREYVLRQFDEDMSDRIQAACQGVCASIDELSGKEVYE